MDRLTPEQRRRNMQHVKNKDSVIELKLRKALWEKGIRYRKNYKELPGKPDIVLTKYKIAVFCDSSFWRGRDFGSDKMPKTNSAFWENKIKRNIERDVEVNKLLREAGWYVLRFWDDEIMKHTEECLAKIENAIMSSSV